MLLAIAYVAFPPPNEEGRYRPPRRRRALTDVAVIATVGLGVWALVTGYFAATGRFEIFREMMTGTSLDYAAAGDTTFAAERPSAINLLLRNILAPLRGEAELIHDMLTPLAVLTGLGAAIGIFKDRRRWALLLAFAAATWIAIALPGQYFNHYYQLWLPPLVIGAGWAIALLHVTLTNLTKRRMNWIPHVVGGATLSLLLLSQLLFYRMNAASDWTPVEYPETMVAESLAHEIDRLLAPGETFYDWGGQPSLYFYNKRRAPSGILMPAWFIKGRLSNQLSARVVADLEHAQPELLVIVKSTWPEQPNENPVSRWLAERFYPLSEDNERGPFVLYVRRGSNLEARLAEATQR